MEIRQKRAYTLYSVSQTMPPSLHLCAFLFSKIHTQHEHPVLKILANTSTPHPTTYHQREHLFNSYTLTLAHSRYCQPEVSTNSMLPQQCIPSPVGEGASLKLLSVLHSLAATVRQDVQMSSYIHPNKKEAGDQHSSDQLMTRRSSRKLQKIGSHTNSYRNCYHKIKFMYRYFTLPFHPLSMSASFYHSVCTACHIFVQVTLILATVATLTWYLK